MANRDQTMLSARVAAAIVSELLAGPVSRAELRRSAGVSNGTIGNAVSLLRRSGVVIDNSGAGGAVYSLRRPEGVRDRLAGALRLSLGDLIEAGGVSPAVGVGLLIEAGCI